jgi:uncharacterized membrane protein YgdD (TMEM256/DUF423 family)
MNSRAHIRLAASVLGLLGVAFGAFGAHGVSDPAAKAWMQTGATYQLAHVLAALAAAGLPRPAVGAAAAFLVGTVVFSGSLYAMALGAPRWLGAITPLGGLAFLAGWAMLALAARRQPD